MTCFVTTSGFHAPALRRGAHVGILMILLGAMVPPREAAAMPPAPPAGTTSTSTATAEPSRASAEAPAPPPTQRAGAASPSAATGPVAPPSHEVSPEAKIDSNPDPIEALLAESKAIENDLVLARAKAETLARAILRSGVSIELRHRLTRFYTASDVSILVDGAPVFAKPAGFPASAQELARVATAPGLHEIELRMTLTSRRDPAYRVRLDQSFMVFVPNERDLRARFAVRERGNMWRFAKRLRGRYRLEVTLRARQAPTSRTKGRLRRAAQPERGGAKP